MFKNNKKIYFKYNNDIYLLIIKRLKDIFNNKKQIKKIYIIYKK